MVGFLFIISPLKRMTKGINFKFSAKQADLLTKLANDMGLDDSSHLVGVAIQTYIKCVKASHDGETIIVMGKAGPTQIQLTGEKDENSSEDEAE